MAAKHRSCLDGNPRFANLKVLDSATADIPEAASKYLWLPKFEAHVVLKSDKLLGKTV